VLNFNTLGYWQTGIPKDLNIICDTGSEALADRIIKAIRTYSDHVVTKDVEWNRGSDQWSFWINDYQAVWFHEAGDYTEINPYIHTNADITDHLNKSFLTENIKSAVISAAYLAKPIKNIIK